MMDEVAAIRMCVDSTEVILIADARTRQDAVRVAEEVNARAYRSSGCGRPARDGRCRPHGPVL
jgi:signal recognition particle GTPase